MPITAAHRQNDARNAALLLAIAAMDCINKPEIAKDRQNALNNVYRLLETYRANPFFGLNSLEDEHPTNSPISLSPVPIIEQHVSEVRTALEQSIAVAFVGRTKDQALDSIERVLRRIAYPQEFPEPVVHDRTAAAHFFDEMVRHLRAT